MTWSNVFESIIVTVLKIVIGLLLVWFLFKVVNLICKKVENKLNKNAKIDPTIASFLVPTIRKASKIFILVIFVGFIGIETSSIAAAITSIGLAIGLAMQGTLSNFAGGIMILLLRPFKVGDYINTCSKSGTVESIQLFYTTLVTIDNVVIKIPNGELLNNTIENMSTKKLRRLDMVFSISYNNDLLLVKDIIKTNIIKSHMVLENKGIFINVYGSNETSVEIISRAWVKNEDYWDLYYFLLEEVRKGFVENNIEMPTSSVYTKIINS